MQPLVLFGPLAAVDPYVPYVVLVLALANLATRAIAHRRHKRQAEDGPEAISRSMAHEATNVLLVVTSFYWLLAGSLEAESIQAVTYHGGFVMTMLVLGLVVTDFFEFEARKVEARTDRPLELPKGALTASALVVGYALFQTVFFLVESYWKAVIS